MERIVASGFLSVMTRTVPHAVDSGPSGQHKLDGMGHVASTCLLNRFAN